MWQHVNNATSETFLIKIQMFAWKCNQMQCEKNGVSLGSWFHEMFSSFVLFVCYHVRRNFQSLLQSVCTWYLCWFVFFFFVTLSIFPRDICILVLMLFQMCDHHLFSLCKSHTPTYRTAISFTFVEKKLFVIHITISRNLSTKYNQHKQCTWHIWLLYI